MPVQVRLGDHKFSLLSQDELQRLAQQQTDALLPFWQAATEIRLQYEAELRSLPRVIGQVALTHLSERLERFHQRPLFGEYVPWLLADLLQITDKPAVQSVALSWLYGYHGVIMLDDCLDQAAHAAREERTIVAALLLVKSTTGIPSDIELMRNVYYHLTETAVAAIHELYEHRNTVTEFTPAARFGVGKKITLLHVCVDALGAVAPAAKMRLTWAHKVINHLAASVQLLDDVTDWEEDASIQSLTLPLTLAVQRSQGDPSDFCLQQRRDILYQLLVTGALEETITEALAQLEKALELLTGQECASDGHCAQYLRTVHEAIHAVLPVLSGTRAELIQHSADDARLDDVLIKAEQHLAVLAQGS